MAPLEGGAGIITAKSTQLVFGAFRPARQVIHVGVRGVVAFIENYAIRQIALRRIGRTI